MPIAALDNAVHAGTTTDSGALASVEEKIDTVFAPVTEALSAVIFFDVSIGGASFPLIVGWLVLAGLVFTVYFGAIQLRGFPVALQTVRGRFSRDTDPGEVTHFQALTSAVSGTVGLGNIAGVAVAVTLGGPGAEELRLEQHAGRVSLQHAYVARHCVSHVVVMAEHFSSVACPHIFPDILWIRTNAIY